MKETKVERFKRVAGNRTDKVIQALEMLGHCAAKENYEFTKSDIDDIFDSLVRAMISLRDKFEGKQPFSLSREEKTGDSNGVIYDDVLLDQINNVSEENGCLIIGNHHYAEGTNPVSVARRPCVFGKWEEVWHQTYRSCKIDKENVLNFVSIHITDIGSLRGFFSQVLDKTTAEEICAWWLAAENGDRITLGQYTIECIIS